MPGRSSLIQRALQQPVLHFLLLGALLFGAHRIVKGDPNAIVISPGVKADLARRFQDERGRPPTAAEAEAALRAWKLEEALFREALQQGLDRNDRGVRTLLVEKLRAQALQEAPPREPTQAELDQWLASHRALYEAPRRYQLEWLAVERARPNAPAEQSELLSKVNAGSDPSQLDRPFFGANLEQPQARERLGEALASQLEALPVGQWRATENAQELLVFRVKSSSGGLPEPAELQARLLLDCRAALQSQAAQEALERLAAQYRFEEPK
jgi:hypothetical protein